MWGDKPGGLVVDTINLTDELADALATYADAAKSDTSPVRKVQDEAVPSMPATTACRSSGSDPTWIQNPNGWTTAHRFNSSAARDPFNGFALFRCVSH